MTGWPREAVAALADLSELRCDAPGIRVPVSRLALRDGTVTADWQIRQPDGGPPRWMRSHARPLSLRPDGSGEVVGYVLDVTAEYAAAAEQQAAREREAAALREGRAQVERLLTNLPAVLFHRRSTVDGTSHLMYRGGDAAAVTGWPDEVLAEVEDLGYPEGGRALELRPDRPAGARIRRGDGRLADAPAGRRPAALDAEPFAAALPRPRGRRRGGRLRARRHGRICRRRGGRGGARARGGGAAGGRAQVERLLAGLPAVIFLREVAPDGSSRLLYRTGDIAGVTGWPAEEMAGEETWRDLAGPDLPDFPAAYRTVLETGEAMVEWRMRRPDGSLQWMRS